MFKRVCSLDDLWEGDMESFDVDGKEILVIHADGGKLFAVSEPGKEEMRPRVLVLL